ncbi:MAG TPA: RDD family protein, partial [Clostridiaceae bacterium]|nr:RDD family protein [Clostridiaceae bacterium]
MSEQHNYSAIKKENLSWFQRLVFRNVVWKRSESPVPYPGRRFLARVLDWTIYYLIWTFINMVPLRGKIIRGLLLLYADSMVVMLIMLILEPLMLSLFGTTPGKAVMGLVLRTDAGEKLPLRDSFRRTFQVFADGMGLNVIILNLLNMSWARRNCAEGKALLWEQENSYVIKDTALWRQIAVIAASLFLITTAMPQIYNLAQYPLHRGNITPENYVENVNEMLYRSGSDTGFWLDDEGFWRDEDGDLIESEAYTPP